MNDHEASRLHSAVLVSPKRERRRDRKTRKLAARDLLARDRAEQKTVARAKADALTAERKATVLLPKAGEPGTAALRTPGRLRLPRHQDTSATLAGAYPFLAEGGLGSDGVFVGQDLYSGSSFVYDPWVLYARGLITAPNLVLAGIVGSGKSSLAKSLYTRSIPFGRRVYVPGDPKGEHTGRRRSGRRQGDRPRPRHVHPTQPPRRRPPPQRTRRHPVGGPGQRTPPRPARRTGRDGARPSTHPAGTHRHRHRAGRGRPHRRGTGASDWSSTGSWHPTRPSIPTGRLTEDGRLRRACAAPPRRGRPRRTLRRPLDCAGSTPRCR
ncbi:MAG: hypothetical protein V9G13_14860 [Marmoricola sp.]